MRFYLVCPGYNCAQYVRACYNSIINQSYKNFHAVIISDGSTDKTAEVINSLPDDSRITKVIYKENKGAAFSRYYAIKEANDEDIIVCLDLDDLITPNCLERVKKEYDKGAWCTYGTWKRPNGKKHKIEYCRQAVLSKRSYRTSKFIFTHLRTFKKFLFNQLIPADFQFPGGEWVRNCTDCALIFPILEQCPPHRIKVISDVIYIYNDNQLSDYSKRCKTGARELLRIIPKKPVYENPRPD